MSLLAPPIPAEHHELLSGGAVRRTARRLAVSSWPWLLFIAVGQALEALRPGLNSAPSSDEGLYLYTGHRIVAHLLHGHVLGDISRSSLAGAPDLYPVLAAAGDALGGLEAARTISLLCAVAAMVAVYGVGLEVFGRVAGLLAAGTFALCGAVVFESHLATVDTLSLALVAGATWLVIYSAKRNGLQWAPEVGAVLCVAVLTAYSAADYVPIVAGLGGALGWSRSRWAAAAKGSIVVAVAAGMAVLATALMGSDLLTSIEATLSSRTVGGSSSFGGAVAVLPWVLPWLVAALVGGALRLRQMWPAVVLLLTGSLVVPVLHVVVAGPATAPVEVALGMVFAAPLAGDLLARGLRAGRTVRPFVVSALALLGGCGLYSAGQLSTSWVQDTNLVAVLRQEIISSPHKAILGEGLWSDRYRLQTLVLPSQWDDTSRFSTGTGRSSYATAIDGSHFGVIYLTLTTPTGRSIGRYLATRDTPYRLAHIVPRYLRGDVVGHWLLYVPKVLDAAARTPLLQRPIVPPATAPGRAPLGRSRSVAHRHADASPRTSASAHAVAPTHTTSPGPTLGSGTRTYCVNGSGVFTACTVPARAPGP